MVFYQNLILLTSIVCLAKVVDVTTTLRINYSKIFLFVTLFILACFFASSVLAKDATPSTTRKERFQDRIETGKVKMATREAALKAKLERFKDKKKAEIADRVNTNLNKINQKQTAQMLKHLDKMSAILDKLEARKTANAAISAARSSITSASSAVKLQADKDYTLTVSSETKVKADAEKVRDLLHQDLQAVREQVIEAKQAVGTAIRGAKSGQ